MGLSSLPLFPTPSVGSRAPRRAWAYSALLERGEKIPALVGRSARRSDATKGWRWRRRILLVGVLAVTSAAGCMTAVKMPPYSPEPLGSISGITVAVGIQVWASSGTSENVPWMTGRPRRVNTRSRRSLRRSRPKEASLQ